MCVMNALSNVLQRLQELGCNRNCLCDVAQLEDLGSLAVSMAAKRHLAHILRT